MSAALGGAAEAHRPPVATDLDAIAPSGIRAVAAAAWTVPNPVHLEFGEPDFDTPPHIVDAAFRAASEGATRYGPSAGIPALRGAICAKLARDNGISGVVPDEVIVTAGGVGALALAYRAILEPGSEILVPDPGWPNLATIAQLIHAVPVRYPLLDDEARRPDLAALDRLVTDRTRALVVNSPSNPLGTVWPVETLRELGEWATARGLWIISDECYDQLWLDEPATSFSVAAPEADVVSVFSLSKSYAMTGWRIGYAYGPAELIARMARIQETQTSCVSTPTQHAALAALTGPQHPVARMRERYRARRDLAVDRATELGLSVDRPSGAFYLWLRLPAGCVDSTTFALRLLADTGVAVAPGRAFGPSGEGCLRLSLAAAEADIDRGLQAIAAALRAEAEPAADHTDLPTQQSPDPVRSAVSGAGT